MSAFGAEIIDGLDEAHDTKEVKAFSLDLNKVMFCAAESKNPSKYKNLYFFWVSKLHVSYMSVQCQKSMWSSTKPRNICIV